MSATTNPSCSCADTLPASPVSSQCTRTRLRRTARCVLFLCLFTCLFCLFCFCLLLVRVLCCVVVASSRSGCVVLCVLCFFVFFSLFLPFHQVPKSVVCPQCRRTTDIPDGQTGWRGLATNYALLNAAHVFAASRGAAAAAGPGGSASSAAGASTSTAVCQMCRRNQRDAEFRCDKCSLLLCAVHAEDHEESHKLTAVSSAAQTPLQHRRELTCYEHNEPLKLFCEQDRSAVCHLCAVTTHRDHGCAISLQAAAAKYGSELRGQLDRAQAAVVGIERTIGAIDKMLQCIDRRETQVSAEIQAHFRSLVEQLNKRAAELVGEAKACATSKRKELRAQRDELQLQIALVRSQREWANSCGLLPSASGAAVPSVNPSVSGCDDGRTTPPLFLFCCCCCCLATPPHSRWPLHPLRSW